MTAVDIGLVLAGFVAWTISTMAAGGGSILLVAVASNLLNGHTIAPVITCTSLIADHGRIALFWRDIEWRVVLWYLPGAIAGATLGSWIFVQVSAHFLQTCIAFFLLSTAWQYRMGSRERSFEMRLPWFLPLSFASGTISAIVGASGLITNPFYLNYGMVKERMLATRAVNSLVIQLSKLACYATFGALNWHLVGHGVSAGAGAVLAIWVTRPYLRRLDPKRFRQLAVGVMLISGAMLLWNQRDWLLGLLRG